VRRTHLIATPKRPRKGLRFGGAFSFFQAVSRDERMMNERFRFGSVPLGQGGVIEGQKARIQEEK